MTGIDCTSEFLRYRDIARSVWNLGLWPYPELRRWDSAEAYERAMALLFHAMVIKPLGQVAREVPYYSPGLATPFIVKPAPATAIMVDKNLPCDPGRLWGNPTVVLEEGGHELHFVGFFDWDQLGIKDMPLAEVSIAKLDARPDLIGHHGLIEVAGAHFMCAAPPVPDPGLA